VCSWFWKEKHLLAHAGSGLCLSAYSEKMDAEIFLVLCENLLSYQHWTCDAYHPYRIILEVRDILYKCAVLHVFT